MTPVPVPSLCAPTVEPTRVVTTHCGNHHSHPTLRTWLPFIPPCASKRGSVSWDEWWHAIQHWGVPGPRRHNLPPVLLSQYRACMHPHMSSNLEFPSNLALPSGPDVLVWHCRTW